MLNHIRFRNDQRIQSIRRRRQRPGLEALEERRVLTTFTVTNLSDAGVGSLRQAIIDANEAAGADTIAFANDVRGVIELNSGQLEITDDLTIDGPGAELLSVDANEHSRVVLVTQTTADISNLTLTGGQARDAPGAGTPPGITYSSGGGIYNNGGEVTLDQVHVIGNEASGTNWATAGGIANVFGASMTILDSLIAGNRAVGIYFASGGALMDDVGSSLTVRDSEVSNNEARVTDAAVPPGLPAAAGAGAIVNAGGSTVRIFSTRILNNHAIGADGANGTEEGEVGVNGTPANGAGLWNTGLSLSGPPAESTAYVADSAFVGNHAIAGDGGNGGPSADGGIGGTTTGAVFNADGAVATLVRTSVVGNVTQGGSGGNGGAGGSGGNAGRSTGGTAIFNVSADVNFINGEIRENSSLPGHGGHAGEGGGNGGNAPVNSVGAVLVAINSGSPDRPSTVNFINTVIADNTVIGGNGGRAGEGGTHGNGGVGQGGAIVTDAGLFTEGDRAATTVTVLNSQITGNTARGGNAGGDGADAGSGRGGAISNFVVPSGHKANLRLRNTVIAENVAMGGLGTNSVGQGGGLYNTGDLDATDRDIDHIFANVAADCHDAYLDDTCTDPNGGVALVAPPLLGDLNNDGELNRSDDVAMARAIVSGSSDSSFDLNGDDAVDAGDSAFLAETLVGVRRGDADLDGDVDFEDFSELAENFGATGAVWGDGDFNGDGDVDFADFVALSSNFGSTS